MDDTLVRSCPGIMNGLGFDFGSVSVLPNKHMVNGFELNHRSIDQYRTLDMTNSHTSSGDSATSSSSIFELDSPDSTDFSNVVLKYINDMLMEEDLESKNFMFEDCLALQAAEKSFYDVLGQNYPPPNSQSLDCTQAYATSSNLVTSGWMSEQAEFESFCVQNLNQSADYSIRELQVRDLHSEFFSNGSCLIASEFDEKGYEWDSRERKHHQLEDSAGLEGRSRKQPAVSLEKMEDTEIFDEVLLCEVRNNASSSCATQNKSQNSVVGKSKSNGQANRRKARGKKNGSKKKQVMDLWTVLPQCAQAVANDDQVTAKELLRKISQYSSPFGDGNQRLAHFFINGLEARLAGTGTPGYTPAVSSTTSAADMLKAYHAYITACPYQTMSHLYANQIIMKSAEKVTRLHIIDFGILYGFQWPSLIEHLSTRKGGPPKLCITGIEFPQPGFRPAERVEETGRRLRKYCERFNVPFEFNCLAQNWESITYEDFKIDGNEMVVVNSLYRFKNLPDDTMVLQSARDGILELVRKINPHIFIHGVVNGTYNAPFFLTRFRDALFHFSSMFDMLDSTISREEPQRAIFEKEVFGRYAVNVIACEGGERVERPETYRQWHVRNTRAGFRQISLDRDIMKKVITSVQSNYHKNFIVDKDGQWMLQGWKGRIIYALSVWKPLND